MQRCEDEPGATPSWVCGACGGEIEGEADRAFPYGDDDVICYACSVARGGVFDDHYERWITAPDLHDLPVETP